MLRPVYARLQWRSDIITILAKAWYFLLRLQIALVLIDEVHLLNESRGAALEAGCISRIRMVSKLPEMKQVSPMCMHVLAVLDAASRCTKRCR